MNGQIVRNPRYPGGITVTFREYAWAMEGMPHSVLAWSGKLRVALASKLGGPKGAGNPAAVRVSTKRQGVMPTKTSEFTGVWASGVASAALPEVSGFAASDHSSAVGCQYSGAGQFFRGATSWRV
jgi:hypothetical protein